MKLFKPCVLILDILFVAWILYNGIDEGFKGISTIQGIVPLTLAVLLVVNVILLWRAP